MFSRRLLCLLVLIAAALSVVGQAHAIELNGIWASDPALCDKVFIKKGKQVVFSPLSDLYGSGFIIDGNRIRGKVARCTIKSNTGCGSAGEADIALSTSIVAD